MSFVTTNTAFSNTIAHFPSYTASRQGHRDHVHIEHVLVLRPYHSVLVQWFSSRRSDSSWRMTRVGSAGVEMRHIYIRPFLYLLFSLCPPTPFPLSRSSFIPLAASRRVYGASLQRRHHGVAWSRLKVPTSIESPIGWEAWAPRVAWHRWRLGGNTDPSTRHTSLRGHPLSLSTPITAITALRCRLWMETRVDPLQREGHPVSSGDRLRKKSLMAIPIGDPRNSFDVVEKSGIAYLKNSREVS